MVAVAVTHSISINRPRISATLASGPVIGCLHNPANGFRDEPIFATVGPIAV